MIWNPGEEAWMRAFEIAKKYIEENGHCSPPRKLIIDGINLNNWFVTQRELFKNGKLSPYKIEKLNGIGMIWRVQSESWDYHFELFRHYVLETGSALIEDVYETKNGVKLGQWIGQQRKDYKIGRISTERTKRLEEIGMVWDVYELEWQKMYALAKEYYEMYGDLLIPYDYTVGDIKLGLWLKNQRGDYKDGIVPQHRIEKFKEIDMIWDVKSSTSTSFPEHAVFYYISKMFNDAKHRCSEFGIEFDIYIPSLRVAIEYDGAVWHKKERTIDRDSNKNIFCQTNNIKLYRIREAPLPLYSNCRCYSVTARDYAALESVIFDIIKQLCTNTLNKSDINIRRDFQSIYAQYKDFTTREWRTGLLSAKSFYKTNGHLVVPAVYIDDNDFRLGQWLITQRRLYNNGELPQKRIAQLSELGMIWISKNEYNWNRNYELTKDYLRQYKNLDIPYNYRGYNVDLRNWLNTQIKKLQNDQLSESRVSLLAHIGVVKK